MRKLGKTQPWMLMFGGQAFFPPTYLTPQALHPWPHPWLLLDDVPPTLPMFWPTPWGFPSILSLVWCWPICSSHLLAASLRKLRLKSNLTVWRGLLGQCTQPQQAFYLLDAFYCLHPGVTSSSWKQQPLIQLLSNWLQVGKPRHPKQSLSYKWQEPENLHTRVYKELGRELRPVNVYF